MCDVVTENKDARIETPIHKEEPEPRFALQRELAWGAGERLGECMALEAMPF